MVDHSPKILASKEKTTTIMTLVQAVIDIQVQFYSPLWHLYFNFKDFNSGVCYVMKISVTESNPNIRPVSYTHLTLPTKLSV